MALCFLALIVVYLGVGGCARNRDLIGTWRGNAGGFNVVLDLKDGGKGFGKLGPIPEQPLTWRVEENKVILRLGDAPEGQRNSPGNANWHNLVGTLGQDRRGLTVDIGIAQPTLYKSAQ